MRRRGAAVEETRRKIIDATFGVHAEQGIVDARLADVAQRAGVSLATVYRHFPALEDLVNACGELTADIVRPPQADQAADALDGIQAPEDRVRRLVEEIHGFAKRGGAAGYALAERDRHRLEILDHELTRLDDQVAGWVRAALAPFDASDETVAIVTGIVDWRTWLRFTSLGVEPDAVSRWAVRATLCEIESAAQHER